MMRDIREYFLSTVDRNMPLRFLRYILELSESFGKHPRTKLFPAVFPLLIYNGERRWTAKSNPIDLYEKTIPLKYLPNFEYYPIIINQLDRSELLRVHNAVSAVFIIENTDAREYDKAIRDLIEILKDVKPEESKLFSEWLNSFLEEIDNKLTKNISYGISHKDGEMQMFAKSLKEYHKELLQQGIEQGIEKKSIEIAQKLRNSGAELSFIAKVTDIPLDKLKNILK